MPARMENPATLVCRAGDPRLKLVVRWMHRKAPEEVDVVHRSTTATQRGAAWALNSDARISRRDTLVPDALPALAAINEALQKVRPATSSIMDAQPGRCDR